MNKFASRMVHWSRKAKLAITVGMLMVSLAAIVTTVNLQRHYNSLREETQDQARLILNMLEQAVGEPLYRGDKDSLTRVVSLAETTAPLQAIRIYDINGMLLLSSHEVQGAAIKSAQYDVTKIYINWHNDALWAAQIVTWNGQPVGSIQIALSTAAMRGKLKAAGYFALIVAVLSVIIIFVLMILTLRQIAAPLQELQRAALNISQGQMHVQIAFAADDEIGQLAQAFNRMSQAIQEREAALQATNQSLQARNAELETTSARLQEFSRSQDQLETALRQITTPAVPVWEGIIVLPLSGQIDRERIETITIGLLNGIQEHDARIAILDITGVPEMDERAAHALLLAAQAADLMGCRPVLTGLRPEFAHAWIALGLQSERLVTRSTLQDGIAWALKLEGSTDRRVRLDAQTNK